MSIVVLVSDMYGRVGDTRYVNEWGAWWSCNGFNVSSIYIDELLPDCYNAGDSLQVESIHARLTRANVIERAQRELLNRLERISPQVVVGFSYGGFLAGTLHAALDSGVTILCISATRLRHVLPLNCSRDRGASIHAIFGAEDPCIPDPRLLDSSRIEHVTIEGVGHEVYRDPQACEAGVRAVVEPLPTALHTT